MHDSEIVELIRAGDSRGLELLLHSYGPLMKYIIAPILNDPSDREECLHDAAMRVWDKIDLYIEERGSFRAWLTAVTRRMALNKRRAVTSIDSVDGDIPADEDSPEEAVLKRERSEQLHSALTKLSTADRTLFYRKYYYMQSTRQIASEVGMTERALEGRLYRIKKKLRRLMGGENCD